MKYNIYCIVHVFFISQSAYIEHREVVAAQGVKIAAKDLEKAIAGMQFTFRDWHFCFLIVIIQESSYRYHVYMCIYFYVRKIK